MTTTNSGQITLSEFTGELLTRGDAGYDDARRVWNGAIDRYPAFIARSPADTGCRSQSAAVGTASPATRSARAG
ncbi:MAG: hypothetical protein ACRDSO_16590 [Pseudonocardiaceae bacterium]